MSKERMKPCPFCGSKGKDLRVDPSGVLRFGGKVDPLGWSVCCKKCLCCGPYHDDKTEAVKSWNTATRDQ